MTYVYYANRMYKNMYINFKNGVLKITFFKITFKTYKEIYKLKEAHRNSPSWKPVKHLF